MANFLVHFISIFVLGLWVGGGAAIGFIATPAIFEHTSSRHLAGQIVAPILRRFDTYVLIAGPIALLATGIEWAGNVGASRTLILKLTLVGTMVALALYSKAALAPEIRKLRSELGELDQVSPADPRRQAFARLHGFSVLCLLAEILLGGLALGISVMLLSARAA